MALAARHAPAASATAAGEGHLREERVGEGVGEAGGGGDVDADGGGEGDAGQGGLRVREGRAQQLGNEGLQSEGVSEDTARPRVDAWGHGHTRPRVHVALWPRRGRTATKGPRGHAQRGRQGALRLCEDRPAYPALLGSAPCPAAPPPEEPRASLRRVSLHLGLTLPPWLLPLHHQPRPVSSDAAQRAPTAPRLSGCPTATPGAPPWPAAAL